MNHIAVHEAAHVTVFLTYGVKASATVSSDRGLTTPEPHHLTAEQQLVVHCAGAVGEHLYGDHAVPLHTGLYGDCINICRLLGVSEDKAMGYATCIAMLIESKEAHFIPEKSHQDLLRQAVREAQTILEGITQ